MRLQHHNRISQTFQQMSDEALTELLSSVDATPGWGTSRSIEVEGARVFVKAVPVTERELADPTSTRNHFGLPLFYNYGVGSAGFGAGRELAAHLKTTAWVLDGQIDSFPLLHHHRVLPLPRQTRIMDHDQFERYVTYWDGDPAIGAFIKAREASTHAIVMISEHVPHVLTEWLPKHQDRICSVIEQGLGVTAFLRGENVTHFDANLANILTDGSQLYFADLGLFLDADFDLSATERDFLSGHRFLDSAEFLSSLQWPLPGQTVAWSKDYLDALLPYSELTDAFSAVFARLASGPKSTGGYDDAMTERLLAEGVAAAIADGS